MEFYTWQKYRCAYDTIPGDDSPALLLIHPVGVGLSRHFWQPFIRQWTASNATQKIYNLDLLGCGDSDMPQRAYYPKDWAEQISHFITNVAQEPVVIVVQGALLPVAIEIVGLSTAKNVKGLILSGPPAWPLMTTPTEKWKINLAWSLFDSPLGNVFYRYARRERFLKSFSERQLFASADDVTDEWLAMLHEGSRNMNSRYAVFSFLAGFWRQDYEGAIRVIQQPTLIVMGENASTIDRSAAKQANGDGTNADERVQNYLAHFQDAKSTIITGRNVMPYESVEEFTEAAKVFANQMTATR